MSINIRHAIMRDDGKFIKSIVWGSMCVPHKVEWTSQLEFAKLWVAKTAAHDDMPGDEGMRVVKVRTEISIVS